MKRLICTSLLMLVSGVVIGWMANNYFYDRSDPLQLNDKRAVKIDTRKPNGSTVDENSYFEVNVDKKTFYKNYFSYLLHEKAYEEAIDFIVEMGSIKEERAKELKIITRQYLRKSIDNNEHDELGSIFEYYLDQYYDDIELLIILAEYHRKRGYPEEAVRTLHLAFTYAYSQQERQRIQQALDELVDQTDQQFSKVDNPVELLNLLELLGTLSLSKPEYLLRQAELYNQLDDSERAKAILVSLIDRGELAEKAKGILADIQPEIVHELTESSAIPLTRKGSHYLVEVRVSDSVDLSLMIDTGASTTTLSRSSFDRFNHSLDYEKLGEHLFNTANGVARGMVYRVDEFVLGEFHLEHIEVSVLDFEPKNGVDGLLGMNVLRQFRFEIDQDKSVLYLRRREAEQ